MREKWIRVYRSARWDVVYNTKTFVWRVKRRTTSKWVAAIEFVANGLSWKRRIEVPEALWWEVMTQARQGVWRREETNEEAQGVVETAGREIVEPEWSIPDIPEPAPNSTPPRRPRDIFQGMAVANSLHEVEPPVTPFREWLQREQQQAVPVATQTTTENVMPSTYGMSFGISNEGLRVRADRAVREAEARYRALAVRGLQLAEHQQETR